MTRRELEKTVRKLLGDQLFAVLATEAPDGPHANIVSFVAADDLRTLIFATPRETRKFANLCRKGDVTLFLDNRTNRRSDFQEVCGVEARGRARELTGAERLTYEPLYVARYPELAGFAAASALVAISVLRYDVVHRFQNVLVLDLHAETGEREG